MSTPAPEPPGASPPGGARRYFTLTFPGDTEPFALASLDSDGLPERYVPGEGWVDMPSLAGYFTGEDTGAREIDEATAERFIDEGIGPLEPSAVEELRGRLD